jgi:uncharacterized protein (DUF2141 family)
VKSVALLALAPATILLAGASPDSGATVSVTITDLRNAKGVVHACMTAEARDFPRCSGVPGVYAATVDARAGTVTLAFADVKPGRYAIAVLHDENRNDRIDKALGMVPKEGYGFSRDAKVRMGPPKFADAAVEIGAEDRQLTIRMRYLL